MQLIMKEGDAMALKDKAIALEQNGVNDHVKMIGRQIKTWIEQVEVASITKQEMRDRINSDIGGYRNNEIIISVLNIDSAVKTELETLISEAKTFTTQ
jgi:hypothetical protein